jgi:hypothetical protein
LETKAMRYAGPSGPVLGTTLETAALPAGIVVPDGDAADDPADAVPLGGGAGTVAVGGSTGVGGTWVGVGRATNVATARGVAVGGIAVGGIAAPGPEHAASINIGNAKSSLDARERATHRAMWRIAPDPVLGTGITPPES